MDTLSKSAILKIKTNISNNNNKDIKKYGIKGIFTYDQFIDKIKQQDNKCYICLQEFKYDGGKWCNFFPSTDRIYNYSPHFSYNIAISCVFCNIRMFKEGLLKRPIKKECGLCEGLNHTYEGTIITKSELFYNLGNDDNSIRDYIYRINNSKKEIPL